MDTQPRTCPRLTVPAPRRAEGTLGGASWPAPDTAAPTPGPQRPPPPCVALRSGREGARATAPPCQVALTHNPSQAVGLGAESGCHGPRHGERSFLALSPVSTLPGEGWGDGQHSGSELLVQVPMLVGAQGFGFGPVGPLAPQPGPLSAPLCREAGTGVLGKGQHVHRPHGGRELGVLEGARGQGDDLQG